MEVLLVPGKIFGTFLELFYNFNVFININQLKIEIMTLFNVSFTQDELKEVIAELEDSIIKEPSNTTLIDAHDYLASVYQYFYK